MAHFDTWLDNLLDKVQPLYIDVGLYVRVFSAPDPAKIDSFRVESEFYADDDPLIRLARVAQHGQAVAPDALDAALAQGANRSGYAECLRMGINLLRGASAFWRGEASEPPDVQQNTSWRHANAT